MSNLNKLKPKNRTEWILLGNIIFWFGFSFYHGLRVIGIID